MYSERGNNMTPKLEYTTLLIRGQKDLQTLGELLIEGWTMQKEIKIEGVEMVLLIRPAPTIAERLKNVRKKWQEQARFYENPKDNKRRELEERDMDNEYIEIVMSAWDETEGMNDEQKLDYLCRLEDCGCEVFGYWFWNETEYTRMIDEKINIKNGTKWEDMTEEQQKLIRIYPFWG